MKILIAFSVFIAFAGFLVCEAIFFPPFFPRPDRNKEFLVSLKDNVTCNDTSTQELIDYIKQKGGEIRYQYCANGTSVMTGFLVYGKQSLENDLQSDANKQKYQIKAVSDNDDFVILQNSNCTTQTNAGWCLARLSDTRITARDYRYPTTAGQDVVIYYMDTGVKDDHPDLVNRTSRSDNYVAGEDNNDQNGHGTGTCSLGMGIVAGTAKKAKCVMVKVCDKNGKCKPSNVLKGLQKVAELCVASGKTVCILNMSLGGKKNTVINDAVGKALDYGVVSVIAAGNSGNDACNNSPASYKNAITVAASNYFNGLSWTSSRGSCVDIIAPGENCKMASNKHNGFVTASGTSFAAPLVAGAAALILADNQTITAQDLYDQLVLKNSIKGIISLGLFPPGTNTPNRFLHVNCPN